MLFFTLNCTSLFHIAIINRCILVCQHSYPLFQREAARPMIQSITATFRSFSPTVSAQRSQFIHDTQTKNHGKPSGRPANEQNGWLAAHTDSQQMQTAVMENLFVKNKNQTKIWTPVSLSVLTILYELSCYPCTNAH